MFTLRKPIHDSLSSVFWHSLSLFRTVLEIFNFKFFWGLTLTSDLWWLQGFSYIFTIQRFIQDFLSNSCWHFLSISCRIRTIRLRIFQSLTLTFDIWWLPEVRNVFSIRKPKNDFLSNFYRHFLSISYRYWDIRLQGFWGLTTFNHQRSPVLKFFFTIRKLIQDFLSNFYWHNNSNSFRFRDIWLQHFLGFDLVLGTSVFTWGQKHFHNLKAYTRLPI